jgi:hypothetical protein
VSVHLHIPNCCPVLDGASPYRTIGKSKRAFKHNQNITTLSKRLEGEMLPFLESKRTDERRRTSLLPIFPEQTAPSGNSVLNGR